MFFYPVHTLPKAALDVICACVGGHGVVWRGGEGCLMNEACQDSMCTYVTSVTFDVILMVIMHCTMYISYYPNVIHQHLHSKGSK